MNNITDPKAFEETFTQIMTGIQDLFKLAAERKPRWDDPCFFQLPDGFERGDEFLQTVLDMIRCNFDPNSLGTVLLNGNIGHILEVVPQNPFRLAYASVVMENRMELPEVWEREIAPRLKEPKGAPGARPQYFIVATTGPEGYGLELINDVSTFFIDHFPDDVTLGGNLGFCLDPVLGNRVRISVWCIHP